MSLLNKIRTDILKFLKQRIELKKFPKNSEEKKRLFKNISFLLVPLVSTPIFYFIFYFINSRYFQFQLFDWWQKKIYFVEWFWIDLVIQILIGYFFLSFSKRISLFLPAQFLFMGIFYTGNAIKNSFFGFPITAYEIYDFHTIKALFYTLKGIFLFYLLSVIIIFVILIVINFKLRKAFILFFLFFAAIFILIRNKPEVILDKLNYTKETWWEKAVMFKKYGGSGYFIFENAQYFFLSVKAPSREEVKKAVGFLKKGTIAGKESGEVVGGDNLRIKKRNVYLIVLESFWDPSLLKKAKFSRDPFYDDFREIWKASGYSKSLSPTFGGATADAEYEILCGFPKLSGGVYFDFYIKNKIPCLPAILQKEGYKTFVFHPDIPDFWNRKNTYPKIGFDKYFSKRDFVFDDLNGELLSDESLYRQSIEKVKKYSSQSPKFVYILTFTGHFPYNLNPQKRPLVVKSKSEIKGVENYANSVYYSSKELVEFMDEILKEDPDALIIALGDHLPSLGKNFQGYRESNLMASSYDQFVSHMFFIRSAVPLLIIDGKRGPKNIGTINHYNLPEIILSFLNVKIPDHFKIIAFKGNFNVRPLAERIIIFNSNGALDQCDLASTKRKCMEVNLWIDHIRILTNDIILGKQYSKEFIKYFK